VWIRRGLDGSVACDAQYTLKEKDIGFLIVDDQDSRAQNTGWIYHSAVHAAISRVSPTPHEGGW